MKKIKLIKKFISELEKMEDHGIYSSIIGPNENPTETEGKWFVDGVGEIKDDIELIKWFDSIMLSHFIYNYTKLVTDEKSAKQALNFLKDIDPGGDIGFLPEIKKRKGVYLIHEYDNEYEVYDAEEFTDWIKDTLEWVDDKTGGIERYLSGWGGSYTFNNFSLLKKLVKKLENIQSSYPSDKFDYEDYEEIIKTK
jgi:hypothetical protein